MAYGAGVVLVNVKLWELRARRSKPSRFLHVQGTRMLSYNGNFFMAFC